MGPILKKNQHFFKCNSRTFSVKSIFCSYGAVYKGVTSSSIEHHISVDEQQTYSHPQIFSDYKNVLDRFIFLEKFVMVWQLKNTIFTSIAFVGFVALHYSFLPSLINLLKRFKDPLRFKTSNHPRIPQGLVYSSSYQALTFFFLLEEFWFWFGLHL